MLLLFNCKVVACYTSYQIALWGLSSDGLARVAPYFMQASDSKSDGSHCNIMTTDHGSNYALNDLLHLWLQIKQLACMLTAIDD